MTKSICLSWTNLCKSAPPLSFLVIKMSFNFTLRVLLLDDDAMIPALSPLKKKTKTKEQKKKTKNLPRLPVSLVSC